jgi:PAS domain S-box-containing protein
LRKKGVSSVYQLPVKNKRGEIRWWAISGAPNYDDHGNLLGSIGIHLDITDQKN